MIVRACLIIVSSAIRILESIIVDDIYLMVRLFVELWRSRQSRGGHRVLDGGVICLQIYAGATGQETGSKSGRVSAGKYCRVFAMGLRGIFTLISIMENNTSTSTVF